MRNINFFISLIIGIICFIMFSYDIENDKGYIAWIWLLLSILNLMHFIRNELKNE